MIALLVLGLTVATWRVTRLLVRDEFPPVRALRDWVVDTFAELDASGAITGGKRADWLQRYALAGSLAASASLATSYGWSSWREALAIVGAIHLIALALLAKPVARALAYVLTCQWCMGVWVAGALVALADVTAGLSVPLPWLVAALGASAAGVMDWVEAEHEQRWTLRQRQIEREERR